MGGLFLFSFKICELFNIATVFGSVYIAFLELAFLFVNVSTFGISSHHDKAHASAVLCFIYSIFAVLAVHASGLVQKDLLIVTSLGIMVFMAIAVAFYFITFRSNHLRSSSS